MPVHWVRVAIDLFKLIEDNLPISGKRGSILVGRSTFLDEMHSNVDWFVCGKDGSSLKVVTPVIVKRGGGGSLLAYKEG